MLKNLLKYLRIRDQGVVSGVRSQEANGTVVTGLLPMGISFQRDPETLFAEYRDHSETKKI